ncbi:hypothetical protein ABPG72_015230 [Tetrahymena utriculariae]
MDLESESSSLNSATMLTPQTPDRWGQQYQFKTFYLTNDQGEQKKDIKDIRTKSIIKLKEKQQRKKKNIHMKKQFNLDQYAIEGIEGDSLRTNLNTQLNELDLTALSLKLRSINSFDFLSSQNNSDNETA